MVEQYQIWFLILNNKGICTTININNQRYSDHHTYKRSTRHYQLVDVSHLLEPCYSATNSTVNQQENETNSIILHTPEYDLQVCYPNQQKRA